MFHHSIYELRHIYGDWLYQCYRRAWRMTDPFHLYVLPTTVTALYLLSGQHLFFKTAFIFMAGAAVGRIFSKAEEPKLDEM
jgi:hypothetical protein